MTATDPGRAGSLAADDVARTLRETAAAEGRDDGPGAPGTADPDVVRTALASLPHDEQQLLWDLHVVERRVEVVAREMGMHVRAVLRRLRVAEQRLTGALSAAHARGAVPQPCLETRTSLPEYVRHDLPAARRRSFEEHLFGCSGCMRAFVDVRQAGWALRDVAPVLLAGAAGSGVAVPVVVGALGAPTTTAVGLLAWPAAVGGALVGAWEWLVRGLRQVFGRPVAVVGAVGATVVAVAAAAMLGGLGGPAADEPPAAAVGAAVPDDGPAAVASASPSPAVSATPEPSPSATAVATPSASPTPTPSPGTAEGTGALVPAVPPEPDPTPTSDATGGDEGDPAEPAGPADPADPGAPGDAAGSGGPDPAPSSDPDPTPAPDPTPTPTRSSEPTPGPTRTDAPPPPPEPELVSVTVGLDVPRHGYYLVDPTGDAQVVAVSARRGNVRVEQRHGGWWVWTRGASRGTVSVELEVTEGARHGARLSFLGLD